MEMVSGLSHITLIVKDLERTAVFLKKIFDAREIYSSGNSTFSLAEEKFFLINNLWFCIMEGEPLAQRTYNHIAFQIQEHEFNKYLARIYEVGAIIKPQRPRVEGEGRSIYFYDYDNHLFELHTGKLDQRLARYAEERGDKAR